MKIMAATGGIGTGNGRDGICLDDAKSRDEWMDVWDDGICFPDLLAKVRRHKSCRIRYRNQEWKAVSMALDGDLSEFAAVKG